MNNVDEKAIYINNTRTNYLVYSNGVVKNSYGVSLKPGRNSCGYLYVILSIAGCKVPMLVHRLVWIAFNGPVSKPYVVHHKDDIRSNNSLSNLQLLTHGDNIRKGLKGICMARPTKLERLLAKPEMQEKLKEIADKRVATNLPH